MPRAPSQGPRSLLFVGLLLAGAGAAGVWLAWKETPHASRSALPANGGAVEGQRELDQTLERALEEQRAHEADPGASAPVAPEPAPELGEIRGRVLDEQGEGIADLPMFLVRDPATDPLSTTCDLGGWFRFERVPYGPWKLAAGGPSTPIVAPRALTLDRAVIELEPFSLPRLGQVEVLVVDELGAAVPEVEIHGYGGPGGEVRERTDALGKAVARFLPAGAVRIFASDPQLGRGNSALDLAPGATQSMTITLRHGP